MTSWVWQWRHKIFNDVGLTESFALVFWRASASQPASQLRRKKCHLQNGLRGWSLPPPLSPSLWQRGHDILSDSFLPSRYSSSHSPIPLFGVEIEPPLGGGSVEVTWRQWASRCPCTEGGTRQARPNRGVVRSSLPMKRNPIWEIEKSDPDGKRWWGGGG